MKNLKIFFIYIELLIFVKSENVLEPGATQESSEGYIIFNSQSIELNKDINFKIKATTFNLNLVKYYYINQLEDLNAHEEILFISEFNPEKKENENNFEINYFKIVKNESEFKSNEGNYLVIFYYTSDFKAEITNIQENIQQNEEGGFNKYESIALVICAVIIIVIIFYCSCKDKKNASSNTSEIQNIQVNVPNNFPNQNYNYNLDTQSNRNFPGLEHENKHHAIIPFQNPVVGELQKICHNKNKQIENLRKQNIMLINQNAKFEQEKLENAAEKLRKEILEEKEKKELERYIENAKKNFEFPNDCEVIIAVEKKIIIKELITLYFKSGDETLKFLVICTKDQIFNSLVNKIFEKIPKLKDFNNFFLGNGIQINEYKSLADNEIKKDGVILVYKKEEND